MIERIDVETTPLNLTELVNRVCDEGITVELERDNKVIARIVPAELTPKLQAKDLPAFLASLPDLGDDAEAFAEDVLSARKLLNLMEAL